MTRASRLFVERASASDEVEYSVTLEAPRAESRRPRLFDSRAWTSAVDARCRAWAESRSHASIDDAMERSWMTERDARRCRCALSLSTADGCGGARALGHSAQSSSRNDGGGDDDGMNAGVLWGVFTIFVILAACLTIWMTASKSSRLRVHRRTMSQAQRELLESQDLSPPPGTHVVMSPGSRERAPHIAIAIEEHSEDES